MIDEDLRSAPPRSGSASPMTTRNRRLLRPPDLRHQLPDSHEATGPATIHRASNHPPGQNEWQKQARKLRRANFDGRAGTGPCHLKGPPSSEAPSRAMMPVTGQPGQYRPGDRTVAHQPY
jgi:hypothetical protein